MKAGRIFHGFLLVFSNAFVGLAGGSLVGAQIIPEGAGLAGPAEALVYGLIGLVLSIAFSVVALLKMSDRRLRFTLFCSMAIALVIVAILFGIRSVRTRNS